MVKRVAIVGTYMWTPRIAASLKKYTGVVCTPVSEVKPRDALRLLGVLGADVTMRIGFRRGQVRPRGILRDLVCLLDILAGGQLAFYWAAAAVPRTLQALAD